MFRRNSIKKDHREHYKELIEQFSKVCVEFDNMDDCYNRLKQTISTSPRENELFLSILQLLICINNEGFSRPVYYELIENSISQIFFREKGHDPWSVFRMRMSRDSKNLKLNLEPFRGKSVSPAPPSLAASGGMPPPPPPPPGQSTSSSEIKLPPRKDWPMIKTKIIPWKKIVPHKVKPNSLWTQIIIL